MDGKDYNPLNFSNSVELSSFINDNSGSNGVYKNSTTTTIDTDKLIQRKRKHNNDMFTSSQKKKRRRHSNPSASSLCQNQYAKPEKITPHTMTSSSSRYSNNSSSTEDTHTPTTLSSFSILRLLKEQKKNILQLVNEYYNLGSSIENIKNLSIENPSFSVDASQLIEEYTEIISDLLTFALIYDEVGAKIEARAKECDELEAEISKKYIFSSPPSSYDSKLIKKYHKLKTKFLKFVNKYYNNPESQILQIIRMYDNIRLKLALRLSRLLNKINKRNNTHTTTTIVPFL